MYRVLLADDIEPFRRKIKRLPFWKEESTHFEIAYEATNGLDALNILKHQKIDVLMTDIRMPFINGIELLKEVKKQNLCPVVILFSEFADFAYAKEGIINGAFDYIVKPVNEEMIIETYERVYKYLSALEDVTDPTREMADKIKESIVSGDESLAKHLSEEAEESMKKKYTDPEKCMHACNELFQHIGKDIFERYEPLNLYCSISYLSNNAQGLLREKVLELMKWTKRFQLDEYSDTIKKLCQNAQENVDEKLNLKTEAEKYFLNSKYLGSQFKKEVGVSFNQYVTCLKIDRAKFLLTEGKLKIAEISDLLGFDTVAYFSKVFRKETGISPGLFRKELEA